MLFRRFRSFELPGNGFLLFLFSNLSYFVNSSGFQLENQAHDHAVGVGVSEAEWKTTIDPEVAVFDKEYIMELDYTRQYTFSFTYPELINETRAVLINVTCSEAQREYPVLFVVKQQRGIMSWQVPLILEQIYEFPRVIRTLCPLENHVKLTQFAKRSVTTVNQTFFLDVSTACHQPVNCTLVASMVENFTVKLDEERKVLVSPSSPKYYQFTFPDGVESIIIEFTSEDDICAIMSLQSINCPVFDLDNNVEFGRIYQTMTKKAALTVQRDAFVGAQFYIVFVIKPVDFECTGVAEKIRPPRGDGFVRTKLVNFTVHRTIASNMYWQAVLGPVAVFLMFYVISAIVMFIDHHLDKRRRETSLEEFDTGISQEVPFASPTQTYGTTTVEAATNLNSSENDPNSRTRRDTIGSEASSIDEADLDSLSDADDLKEIYRTKTLLYVADLSRKGRRVLSSKYKLYHRNLVTIAIFYGLPVVQLVLTYQSVLNQTGNEDLCYYNFFCARPLGLLSAFNNVFSNVGYIMLGILFLLITYRRDYKNKSDIARNPELEKKFGIPQHFGLFYAMGLALIMEGVLSACYHVCPSYSNFQFDTAFMYIIAGLCMLKIYQTRHPDVNPTAHSSYFFLAWIIFFGVIGVVYGHGSIAFWVILALLHISICLLLTVQIYYIGRWHIDRNIFKRTYNLMRTECCSRPMYMDRMILLIIGNAANWTLALYGAITQPRDVSSFILAIFIMNLLLYMLCYIFMKIRNKEKIPAIAVLFIAMATLVWASALYFFVQHLTSWQLSPAESREGNKSCLLMDFYDDHDIWHFLSATALFFSFMILLTLDDALHQTPRDRIPVF